MRRLGRAVPAFLARRAKLVLVVWLLFVAALAIRGSNLEHQLNVRTPVVDGSQSARVHELVLREFGNESALIVMLRGPERSIDEQGRDLVEALERGSRFVVLSPWSRGVDPERLRPKPGVAAVVVRADGISQEDAVAMIPPVRRQIEANVHAPVRTDIAGLPVLLDSMLKSSEEAAASGEMIAIPLLLIVLLIVFRSALAALVPLIAGGAVVAASRGVLSLLAVPIDIDVFAVAVTAMMGLALGVDYSLLVVSRYREARRDGGEPEEVLAATIVASARAVVPAGCGLLIAMVAAVAVYPTVTTQTIAIAVTVVTLLSMVSALCIVPPVLFLLGDNLDRWSLRKVETARIAPLRWSRRLVARPGVVAAMVLFLALLSGWAFSLDSGLANIRFLPEDAPGRVDQEAIEDELGPGWAAPYEIAVNGYGRPVTDPEQLQALARFQRRVEDDPGVESVVGFAPIARGLRPLDRVGDALAGQARAVARLDRGITRLREGAAAGSDGLSSAAEGARAIHFGVGATHEGSGLLADGLRIASSGSERLGEGLGQASEGGGRLLEGAGKASRGANRLAEGLDKAREGTGEIRGSARLLENAMLSGEERLTEVGDPLRASGEQLDVAWQALQRMTIGRGDPQYEAALRAVAEADRYLTGEDVRTGQQADPAYAGVEAGVGRALGQFETGLYLAGLMSKNGGKAADGIEKLAKGSAKLDRGLRRLEAGSRRLSRGLDALAQGGERLSPGLVRLGEGAERLAGGLGMLETGTGQLADGLGGGAQKAKLLSGGLGRISTALERRQDGVDGVERLDERSPGLFDSGYFKLAALDGAAPGQRQQLAFLLNLDGGGDVARMMVVSPYDPMSTEAVATKRRLEADAADLAAHAGVEADVGGLTPGLIEANTEIRDELPWVRLALSLVSFLILVPVTRSLTIPLIASLLNLLTVSAVFGALALLFDGSLLGGPGYVDASILLLAMIVMFGLAIDYEVFIFSRMREEYVRTGSPTEALENGLDRTAHVITGAAVIMIVAFLSFAVAGLISMRNFGVAQALGVFIDAFVIRLIVFPAILVRLGHRAWWMPRWLDRVLPGGKATPPAEAEPAPA